MYNDITISGWWFEPLLKNMSSSMGRIIPYIMEINPNVWNHQPDYITILCEIMVRI